MDRLWKASFPIAKSEHDELQAYRSSKSSDASEDSTLEQWDVAYWSNKLQKEKFDFDPDVLRPWFESDRVVNGAFEVANKLFGLSFKEESSVPVYHPDVKVYAVYDGLPPAGNSKLDSSASNYLGLFYLDLFPRSTKKAGAWCTRFRSQWKPDESSSMRPHVSVVCNFTPPGDNGKALLSFSEVRTMFHEFGHALHGLLSDCRYQSQSCTSVFRDFVELPSQIMENWITQESVLDLFASHHETGEKLPRELIAKIRDTQTFRAATATVRQLKFGLIDWYWYGRDPSDAFDMDVEEYEKKALEKHESILPHIDGTAHSCGFQHIFSGGYSAGYYGYKWAEVLDADAFEQFEQNGLFDQETARKFREHILSKGGTEHPAELYRRFRGKDPDPKALLRRDGLIK